jgi:hypothetical protein
MLRFTKTGHVFARWREHVRVNGFVCLSIVSTILYLLSLAGTFLSANLCMYAP